MAESLRAVAEVVALVISGAAVLVVAYGAAQAFARLAAAALTGRVGHGARKIIWRDLGMWLLLGLEFELAADIVESVVTPSWQELGKLGAIAAIRTFLNYFLEKDLERSAEPRPRE